MFINRWCFFLAAPFALAALTLAALVVTGNKDGVRESEKFVTASANFDCGANKSFKNRVFLPVFFVDDVADSTRGPHGRFPSERVHEIVRLVALFAISSSATIPPTGVIG